jgi:hypothetical protein
MFMPWSVRWLYHEIMSCLPEIACDKVKQPDDKTAEELKRKVQNANHHHIL